MTILEARYIGPYEVEKRAWFTWQKYDLRYDARKAMLALEQRFKDYYEFQLVTV